MESVLERLKITIGKISAGKAEQILGGTLPLCAPQAARQNMHAGGSMAKLFCFIHVLPRTLSVGDQKRRGMSMKSPPEGFLHQPHR